MRTLSLVSIAVIFSVTPDVACARGIGRMLGGFIARGVVHAGANAASKAYATAPKTYGPGVLTVDQLVGCLNRANTLDKDSENLEAQRQKLSAANSALDNLEQQLESRRVSFDRRSRLEIERFNAAVDDFNGQAQTLKASQQEFNRKIGMHNVDTGAFNTACAKNYYADDMETARKIAGL